MSSGTGSPRPGRSPRGLATGGGGGRRQLGVGDTSAFVIGKVLSCEKHPDADRLSVCMVDDGSGEPRQIVCGAPNVAAGQTVAGARPGALMPGGQKLGEGTAR